MQRKGILIFTAVLLLIVGLVFLFVNDFVKSFGKGLGAEPPDKIVSIQSPGCFLPDSKIGIKNLLGRLKQNPNWKVISQSDVSGKPELDGLLAYRVFDKKGKIIRKDDDGYIELDNSIKNPDLIGYKVALIETLKSEKQVVGNWSPDFGYKLTTSSCDEKRFKLTIHSTFKFGMQSCLLFKNRNIGLVVFEMGYDPQRAFTMEALNTVRDDISQAMKSPK